jgi:hypothetical protein
MNMGIGINDEMCQGIAEIDLHKIVDFNGDRLQIGDHVVFAMGGRLAEGIVICIGLPEFAPMVMVESTNVKGRTATVSGEGIIKVCV